MSKTYLLHSKCHMWIIFLLIPTSILCYFLDGNTTYKTDFCKQKCHIRKKNVCCLYGPTAYGYLCKNKGDYVPLTDSEKRDLLHAFNTIRNGIAGGNASRDDLKGITAANMHVFSYSRELEYTAGCWARQCRFGHSRCRAVRDGRLGETICLTRHLTIPKELLVEKYTKFLSCCPNTFLGHFPKFTTKVIDSLKLPYVGDDERNRETVQLIWALTKYIGCYRVIFPHDQLEHMLILLVCHYFPKGNQYKKPIFIRGQPTSRCNDNANEGEYPNLCGRVRSLTEDPWGGPLKGSKITCNIINIFILLLLYFITI